jgi:hypothetical protein
VDAWHYIGCRTAGFSQAKDWTDGWGADAAVGRTLAAHGRGASMTAGGGAARKVGRGIGKTVKWLLIIGALIVVIVVIAIFISLGQAGSESEESSKEVSPAEYAAIQEGDTRASVERLIGAEPESENETVSGGQTLSCIYYGVLASEGTYQFCFEDGRLFSKSRM